MLVQRSHPGFKRRVEQSSHVGATKRASGTQVKQPVASQVLQLGPQAAQVPAASIKKPTLQLRHPVISQLRQFVVQTVQVLVASTNKPASHTRHPVISQLVQLRLQVIQIPVASTKKVGLQVRQVSVGTAVHVRHSAIRFEHASRTQSPLLMMWCRVQEVHLIAVWQVRQSVGQAVHEVVVSGKKPGLH